VTSQVEFGLFVLKNNTRVDDVGLSQTDSMADPEILKRGSGIRRTVSCSPFSTGKGDLLKKKSSPIMGAGHPPLPLNLNPL